MSSTGLFESTICSLVGHLVPKGLLPPKWTGGPFATLLAVASRARVCPHLASLAAVPRACVDLLSGPFAVSHHVRARPLVAAPRLFTLAFSP